MTELFDKDYFENGIVSGKSCYENYRWMPELTIKMAHRLIKYLDLKGSEKILDFGCAKGYLVKALRLLDVEAMGCDISNYAINNIDPEVRPYCAIIKNKKAPIIFNSNFDWVISKDVLEHMKEADLDLLLDDCCKKTLKMFHIIPLGDKNGKYIVPEYELDKTHILAKNVDWWFDKFKSHKWKIKSFSYKVPGIKDNWTNKYERGNGFFVLERNKSKPV